MAERTRPVRKSPPLSLPGRDYDGYRSPTERLFADFSYSQLLPKLSLLYSESDAFNATDPSCSFYGYRSDYYRDFDLKLGPRAYQVQCKGVGFLYRILEVSLKNRNTSSLKERLYLRRKFKKLRKTLLDFWIREFINVLCQGFYLRSNRFFLFSTYLLSLSAWNDKKIRFKTEKHSNVY